MESFSCVYSEADGGSTLSVQINGEWISVTRKYCLTAIQIAAVVTMVVSVMENESTSTLASMLAREILATLA